MKTPFLIRSLLISFILFAFGSVQTYGFELVLPREKKNYVSSDYALISGKSSNAETLTLNGEKFYAASNGAFTRSIKLKEGENRIVIRSNYKTQVYRFIKKSANKPVKEEICEFDRRHAIVKKDNTPLRSTPVDAGLNRISHLFKDTNLLINGSQGEFYRVYLSSDKTAWIAKNDVDINCEENNEPAAFLNMSNSKYKNASVQTISFTQNLPYTVNENGKEILFKVYNPELSDNSVYTVNIKKPDRYYYRVSLDDGIYTFKVSEIPRSIQDCTIVIDAGHGGAEKGAIGCLGDEEKNINLKIALEVREFLKNTGANVIMTRECDSNVSLEDRVKIARSNDADIFVSIHLNSIGDVEFNPHKHRGTSVYYFNPNSRELAEILEKSVTKHAGTRNDGVRTASFAVTRPSDYAGVLVETAYMISPSDSILYNSDDFASNAARGIADGIIEFVER